MVRGLKQRRADQGRRGGGDAFGEVRFEISLPPTLLLWRREAAPILLLPGHFHLRANDLDRLLEVFPYEIGPQNSVAVNELLPGALKGERVQASAQCAA